jgi:glycosyltransferase involved in cell wall biosynthesis
MRAAVLIPSRNRPEMLGRLVASLVDQERLAMPVIVGLSQRDPGRQAIEHWDQVNYIKVVSCPIGVGAARHRMIELAHKWGYRRILFIDDDCRVKVAAINSFMEEFRKAGVVWYAAWNSYYDLIGSHIGNTSMVYGLDVPAVVKIGNFDPRLKFAEDHDLRLRLLLRYGPDFWCHSRALVLRHLTKRSDTSSKGGVTEYSRSRAEQHAAYLNQKFGWEVARARKFDVHIRYVAFTNALIKGEVKKTYTIKALQGGWLNAAIRGRSR